MGGRSKKKKKAHGDAAASPASRPAADATGGGPTRRITTPPAGSGGGAEDYPPLEEALDLMEDARDALREKDYQEAYEAVEDALELAEHEMSAAQVAECHALLAEVRAARGGSGESGDSEGSDYSVETFGDVLAFLKRHKLAHLREPLYEFGFDSMELLREITEDECIDEVGMDDGDIDGLFAALDLADDEQASDSDDHAAAEDPQEEEAQGHKKKGKGKGKGKGKKSKPAGKRVPDADTISLGGSSLASSDGAPSPPSSDTDGDDESVPRFMRRTESARQWSREKRSERKKRRDTRATAGRVTDPSVGKRLTKPREPRLTAPMTKSMQRRRQLEQEAREERSKQRRHSARDMHAARGEVWEEGTRTAAAGVESARDVESSFGTSPGARINFGGRRDTVIHDGHSREEVPDRFYSDTMEGAFAPGTSRGARVRGREDGLIPVKDESLGTPGEFFDPKQSDFHEDNLGVKGAVLKGRVVDKPRPVEGPDSLKYSHVTQGSDFDVFAKLMPGPVEGAAPEVARTQEEAMGMTQAYEKKHSEAQERRRQIEARAAAERVLPHERIEPPRETTKVDAKLPRAATVSTKAFENAIKSRNDEVALEKRLRAQEIGAGHTSLKPTRVRAPSVADKVTAAFDHAMKAASDQREGLREYTPSAHRPTGPTKFEHVPTRAEQPTASMVSYQAEAHAPRERSDSTGSKWTGAPTKFAQVPSAAGVVTAKMDAYVKAPREKEKPEEQLRRYKKKKKKVKATKFKRVPRAARASTRAQPVQANDREVIFDPNERVVVSYDLDPVTGKVVMRRERITSHGIEEIRKY